MKKGIALVLALVMILSLAVGCSSDSGDKAVDSGDKGGKDGLKIGVLIYKYDDTYISTVRQALEKEAKTANIELVMNDGKGDQAQQNDQLDILIEKDVDALIVNIVDIGAAESVIGKAKTAITVQ